MITEHQENLSESPSTIIQQLATRYKKRRYRAHAVFALILILAITFVTLQTDNVVSSKLRTTKHTEFNGDLGSISPFAKKKVLWSFIRELMVV